MKLSKEQQETSMEKESAASFKVVLKMNQTSSNWKQIANTIPKRYSKRKLEEIKSGKPAIEPSSTTTTTTTTSEATVVETPSVEVVEKQQKKEIETKPVRLTRAIAIDCEMVGVGENGKDSILARVSLVNQFCECVYDKYVLPTEPVTDYRTAVSGIRPDDLKKENKAVSFKKVQAEVAEIIKDRILVGHAIHNDLKVLLLDHAKKKIRDTQKAKFLRTKHSGIGSLTSLKFLSKALLDVDIQTGEHNSVQDAQATMKIYMMYKKEWEAELKNRRLLKKQQSKPAAEQLIIGMGPSVSNVENADLTLSSVKGNEKHKRFLRRKIKSRKSFNKK